MIRRATPIAALAALAVALWTADAVAAGSLVPTTLLSANFNGDPAGSPPNIALPERPTATTSCSSRRAARSRFSRRAADW